MEYISSVQAAEKWGISVRRVQFLCAENKIPDVKRIGHQWLIPANAQNPQNIKVKAADTTDLQTYHFPIFIYTGRFADRSGLCDDELTLLDAQLSAAKNNFTESYEICSRLISSSQIISVRFGAYCTKAYCSIVMGLPTELVACISAMEKIRDESHAHYEDYSLLIGFIKHMSNFDSTDLQNIDSDKLSPDALITYQLTVLNLSVTFMSTESYNAIESYFLFVRQMKARGILPALLAAYGYLAFICERNGEMQRKQKCVEQVCKIGYEQGYYSLLSRSTNFCNSDYMLCLEQYGAVFKQKIIDMRRENSSNYRTCFNYLRNMNVFIDKTAEQTEVLILLSGNKTNEAIAEIMGLSEDGVLQIINELCRHYGYDTREELVLYCKRILQITESGLE